MDGDRCSRMRGPLAPHAEGFRRWLVSSGFAPASVQHRLTLFSQFSGWLAAEGIAPGEVTAAVAERFAAARRARGHVTWASPASMTLPMRYLRDIGAVPPAATPDPGVRSYLGVARRFLAGSAKRRSLRELTAADVTAFVVAECGPGGPSAKKTVTALGSLLRYLHLAGLTAVPLAAAVPRVARRRPGPAPHGIDGPQVARLLSACDRRTEEGRRDLAIVMLLARPWLRAGEVAALPLDDFDWRRGEVEIHGKGNRHERLPLPSDVGQAVTGYLRGRRARTLIGRAS